MKIEEAFRSASFSGAEDQAAAWMMEHPHQAAGMTVRELAAEVYVSPATILRVVHKCGYQGWRQFSADLLLYSESVKQQPVSINMSRPFGQQGSAAAIVSSIRSLFEQTVREAAGLISLKDVEQAAGILSQADRIFVFARGDSSLTARSFMNKLVKVNIHPILATEYGQEIEESRNMRAGDVALFVSYHGQTRSLVRCASILREKSIFSILVTKEGISPLAQKCRLVLPVPAHEEKRRIANFHSRIGMEFILDVLFSVFYQRSYVRFEQHKSMLDQSR